MDRLGILCSARDCCSGPVGACAAVRAHVSHSTPLVACRLSFRVPPFPPPLVTPSSGDYSPPQPAAGEGRAGIGRRRVMHACMVEGKRRGIISQNMACFSAVHPQKANTVCASSEQETSCAQLLTSQ
jgi:hypothetical protein